MSDLIHVWPRFTAIGAVEDRAKNVGLVARPLSEWSEEFGPVVWWRFPVNEAAWIGTPNDSDWPGYHTHWTLHPDTPLQGGAGNG